MKFNKKKLKLLCKEIFYMGYLVIVDGLRFDLEKIEVVYSMFKLNNVKVVR